MMATNGNQDSDQEKIERPTNLYENGFLENKNDQGSQDLKLQLTMDDFPPQFRPRSTQVTPEDKLLRDYLRAPMYTRAMMEMAALRL